jgi:hypothetical protein
MVSGMRGALLAAVVMLVMLAVRVGVSAAADAIVAFSPSSATGTVGSSIAVDVTVANVAADPGLANYDLTLRFDPTVVRLDSFQDSGFVTNGQNGQNVVICVTGAIDNTGGAVEAQCQAIPLPGGPGASTTSAAVLLHASFTGLTSGTSPLTISGTLAGPTGTAIPVSFADGAIHVTAATAGPSPTVAATATPTASPAASPSPSATPTEATVATPALTRVPTATATVSPVKAPLTGDGGGGSATSAFPRIFVILGIIAIVAALVPLAVRQLWRSHR